MRLFTLLHGFCLFVFHQSMGQCSSANAGPDVTICSGGSSQIGTSAVGGYSYSWSPTTGLSNPSIAQPTASPSSTTTYTLTQFAPNMLTNPGFESGNTGFGTDYMYLSTCGCTSGWYYDPQTVNFGCQVWSYSGSKMLTAQPYATNPSNYRLWYQTVNVTTNTFYEFSGFVARLNALNVDFSITITGNASGANTRSFSTPSGCGTWGQFQFGYFSGSDTQATIEIRITNSGNIVAAFDDLKFGCYTTDDVTVTVTGGGPSVIPAGPITYYNQYETTSYFTFTCSGGSSYQWYKNNTAISGATSQQLTINFSNITSFTDVYKCVNSCGTSNEVTFNYVGCNDAGDYPVSVQYGGSCASAYPIALTQPNMGTGGEYYWNFLSNPTCYFFSGITGVNDNSGTYNYSGCTDYGEQLITRAKATNGTEIWMNIGVSVALGCRSGGGANDIKSKNDLPDIKEELAVKFMPNPAEDMVTIVATSQIKQIEIFSITGVRLRLVRVGHTSTAYITVQDLPPGFYSIRVTTDSGAKILKLVTQ